ncbi:hypothetical protein DBP88_05080 [Enterobacter hormaechei]|nr:hypothetical protein DBP88_05080 [Enterobacter hormaechei]
MHFLLPGYPQEHSAPDGANLQGQDFCGLQARSNFIFSFLLHTAFLPDEQDFLYLNQLYPHFVLDIIRVKTNQGKRAS